MISSVLLPLLSCIMAVLSSVLILWYHPPAPGPLLLPVQLLVQFLYNHDVYITANAFLVATLLLQSGSGCPTPCMRGTLPPAHPAHRRRDDPSAPTAPADGAMIFEIVVSLPCSK
jgi:hypothetical protein